MDRTLCFFTGLGPEECQIRGHPAFVFVAYTPKHCLLPSEVLHYQCRKLHNFETWCLRHGEALLILPARILNILEIELSQETHLHTHIIYDLALTIVLRTFPRGDYTLPTHQNLRTPFPLFALEIIPSLSLSRRRRRVRKQNISFHPL